MSSNSNENIWIASSDGDMARVKQLLSMGQSVNSQDESGYAPIHAAASYGHIELIKYLMTLPDIDMYLLDHEDGDSALNYCEEVETLKVLMDFYVKDFANCKLKPANNVPFSSSASTNPVATGGDSTNKNIPCEVLQLHRNKNGQTLFDKMVAEENESMVEFMINERYIASAGDGSSLPEGFSVMLREKTPGDGNNGTGEDDDASQQVFRLNVGPNGDITPMEEEEQEEDRSKKQRC